MIKAAEKELADLSVSKHDRITINLFKDEFESCFANMIEGDSDKYALDAIEAAVAIMSLARPNARILKQIRREGSKSARNKRSADTKERDKEIAKQLRDIATKNEIPPLQAGAV